MARLNEPPMSTDSLETLRKKLLRQNRDLAKSNNVRALKIRELENDCACMLSENIELRGRILELEKQVEDNEARRIADHALAIKAKLESQLTEWGTLLAGLGLEPPPKRQYSPSVRKTSRRRTSFGAPRISPSQRRLRDVARDIEDLGHISEHKSYPRLSMNPEQILALRTEADSSDSLDLGPPPVSQFLDDEPAKTDSPRATSPPKVSEPREQPRIEPPEMLPSPKSDRQVNNSPSPTKHIDFSSPEPVSTPQLKHQEEPKQEPIKPLQLKSQKPNPESTSAAPTKSGMKRKFTSNDEGDKAKRPQQDENQAPRLISGKPSIRDKTGGKTLKELTTIRRDAREQGPTPVASRKPLSAKSTNDDMTSPKKNSKSTKPGVTDPVAPTKVELNKPKVHQERLKTKAKNKASAKVATIPTPEPAPAVTTTILEPATKPVTTPVELQMPSHSPEPAPPTKVSRDGDTPPPASISDEGETSRPSRRSRPTISYAEPNLRDKMRRPTKELVDAVAGSRRTSHSEPVQRDIPKRKHESDTGGSSASSTDAESGNIPGSPLTQKSSSVEEEPAPVAERRKRPSSAATKTLEGGDVEGVGDVASREETPESITTTPEEVDLYEFTTSSPKQGISDGRRRKSNARYAKASRRYSSAVNNDDEFDVKEQEQPSSRRRSMMV